MNECPVCFTLSRSARSYPACAQSRAILQSGYSLVTYETPYLPASADGSASVRGRAQSCSSLRVSIVFGVLSRAAVEETRSRHWMYF